MFLQPLALGIQICSGINRQGSSQILAAAGAGILIGPKESTEFASYDTLQPVWVANAPNGKNLVESCDAITIFTARQSTIEQSRKDYPGYLQCRSDLYAREWNAL